MDTGQVSPFEAHVPQAGLDDLRERLARTRWIDEFPGQGRHGGRASDTTATGFIVR
jgi:hypothetical protein